MGFGISDSEIDVILSPVFGCDGTPAAAPESLIQILCCKEDPRVFGSHHDAIVSDFPLNYLETPPPAPTSDLPTVVNTRHKVIWAEESLQEYTDLITPVLTELRKLWLDSSSPTSLSVLLSQTNNVLTSAAKATQKVIDLSKPEILLLSSDKSEIQGIDSHLCAQPSRKLRGLLQLNPMFTLMRSSTLFFPLILGP